MNFFWGEPLPLNIVEAFSTWKCQRASKSQIWGFLEDIRVWLEWATLEAVWRFLNKYIKFQGVSARWLTCHACEIKINNSLSPQVPQQLRILILAALRDLMLIDQCAWVKASANKPSVINLLWKAHKGTLPQIQFVKWENELSTDFKLFVITIIACI